MKRRNRFLAILLTLCLLASLVVMPAAAAEKSVAELEHELTAAQTELTQAQSALTAANTAVQNAESAVKTAEDKKAQAEKDKADANAVLASDSVTDDEKTSAQEKLDDAQKILETVDTEISNAKSTLESVKSTANIAEKEAAVTAAQTEVNNKKAALEEAQKNEAAQNPPSTPGSNDIACSVSTVDFGKLAKGTTSGLSKTFTITNRSSYNMTLSASSVTGYRISGASGTLSAGSSATVTVELSSTSSTGSYNGTLTVYASFENGTGSYPVSVLLYAEVVAEGYSITLDPASKDFGKLSEGYEEKAATDVGITVTVQNKGASSVQMNGVKGNDHFTVTAVATESEVLRNGDKTSYKIAPKHGLAIGTYTDTITFQTREGATASFKATVAVEKKLAPLSVEPAALDFGTVEEGYAAVDYKTVTIKNNTDSALMLTQPTSYSYEISTLTQTALPAGGSVTLNIRPRTGMPAAQYGGVIEIDGGKEQARLNVQFAVNRPAGPSSFGDVPSDSTFAADIAYVSQKGLMSGVGGGNFNPKSPITRGQLVTILYRLEGQPAVSGLGFSDVAAGSYCEKAVKWAATTGVTTGGTDGLFRPNEPISREQMATFMYRYNRYKGYSASQLADLSAFSDAGSIASYAKDAISWANGAGLINGTGAGLLNPSGGANRGQAAAILHRYCVSIGQ